MNEKETITMCQCIQYTLRCNWNWFMIWVAARIQRHVSALNLWSESYVNVIHASVDRRGTDTGWKLCFVFFFTIFTEFHVSHNNIYFWIAWSREIYIRQQLQLQHRGQKNKCIYSISCKTLALVACFIGIAVFCPFPHRNVYLK